MEQLYRDIFKTHRSAKNKDKTRMQQEKSNSWTHLTILRQNNLESTSIKKRGRSRQDSNLRSQRESDFQSDALTTRPRLPRSGGFRSDQLHLHRPRGANTWRQISTRNLHGDSKRYSSLNHFKTCEGKNLLPQSQMTQKYYFSVFREQRKRSAWLLQPTNRCCALLVVTLFVRSPSYFFFFSSFLSYCFSLSFALVPFQFFPFTPCSCLFIPCSSLPFSTYFLLRAPMVVSCAHRQILPHCRPQQCPFSGPCHLLPLLPFPAQCRSVVNRSLVGYFSSSFRTPSYCSPIGPLLKVPCHQSQSH